MQNKENQPFSKRFGHVGKNQEITIREDAPENFRYAVIAIARKDAHLASSDLREIICQVLRIRPDKEHNWGDSYISNEVGNLMDSCEWYRVYDIIEAIYSFLERCRQNATSDYEESINECLVEMGIGWKLVNGIIETRGEEAFEHVVQDALGALDDADLTTSKQELDEAIRALSRRPEPNLELAKKPVHCLEYILIHEMVHLLERRHNERFMAYIDKFLPQWRAYKEELNRFPISHVEWNY